MTKNKDIVQRTKPDLIKLVRQKTGFRQNEAKIALEAVLDAIRESLVKGESVHCASLGKFYVTERAARDGRNPKTGEMVQVGARKITKFAAAELLKKAVNGK